MLERLGYHVTVRTSSVETLESFRTAPDKFDLVITDTTMPNMTGIQFAKKLIEIRSDIPIIKIWLLYLLLNEIGYLQGIARSVISV